MTRRRALPLTLAMAACGGRREPAADVFPEILAGWRRMSMRAAAVADAPDPVPQASVVRVTVAAYEGPGKVEARAYELTRSEVGLDIAQRWRPSADTVFFWVRRWFVVIRWEQADRKALREF